MKKISKYTRENDIRMHIDGAKIYNKPAHTGISVKNYAGLFDTVYVSLYKDSNAALGTILTGTTEFCEGLYHTRRMFGGSMPNAWPFAALANEYVDSFPGDYEKSLEVAKVIFNLLGSKFRLEKSQWLECNKVSCS